MPDVTWLTRYGPEGASSRYRAYQFEPGLSEAGWRSSFEPLSTLDSTPLRSLGGVTRRLARLSGLRSGDVTVVQKEPVMPPWVYPTGLVSLRDRGPVLWDIDDAVWIGRRGAGRMAHDMCRRCDVVVAGNDLLAEWASRRGGRVEIVPTCFEPPDESVSGAPTADDRSTIGSLNVVWIGSPATAGLLARYGATLRSVLGLCADVHMEFIGGHPPTEVRNHPRVRFTEWSADAEEEGLRRAHFGLALQPRTEYADHKCGFKTVQYMAYGVMPIVTDNPVHRSIVGGLGLLLADPVDVRELVDRVAERPTSAEAHDLVERWRISFSRERALNDWIRILGSVG